MGSFAHRVGRIAEEKMASHTPKPIDTEDIQQPNESKAVHSTKSKKPDDISIDIPMDPKLSNKDDKNKSKAGPNEPPVSETKNTEMNDDPTPNGVKLDDGKTKSKKPQLGLGIEMIAPSSIVLTGKLTSVQRLANFAETLKRKVNYFPAIFFRFCSHFRALIIKKFWFAIRHPILLLTQLTLPLLAFGISYAFLYFFFTVVLTTTAEGGGGQKPITFDLSVRLIRYLLVCYC